MASTAWRNLADTVPGSGLNAVPSMNQNNNLISFLAILQFYQIDLLNITWDNTLDKVGSGATAKVRQDQLEIATSFAFKVIRLSAATDNASFDEVATFNALVSEITVLGHPSLRYHQNIVKLEGVSWETPTQDHDPLPVLLFERAQHGDLYSFISSDRGRQMTLDDRLSFCVDVASAIFAMHHGRMAHGDVKPQNVLVFEDRGGGLYTKLTDFGWAGWAAENDHGAWIKLPKSAPWNAPEYHHREFPIAAAQKMDVFSLGMLCFWILFYDVPIPDQAIIFEDTVQCGSYLGSIGSLFENRPIIERLKYEERFHSFVHQVLQSVSPRYEQESDLALFFSSSLSTSPAHRRIVMKALAPSLDNRWILGPQSTGVPQVVDHDAVIFEIRYSLASLIRAPYNIRKHVIARLEDLTRSPINSTICRNAAFQLALCYKIGLGVAANDVLVARMLEESSHSSEDLSSEIQVLRESFDYDTYKNGTLIALGGMKGTLKQHPIVNRYGLLGSDQENHLKALKREIHDLQNIFQEPFVAIEDLKFELTQLLFRCQRIDEADILLREMLQEVQYAKEMYEDGGIEEIRRNERRMRQNGLVPIMAMPTVRPPVLGPEAISLDEIMALVNKKVPMSINVLEQLARVFRARGQLREAAWLTFQSTQWSIQHDGELHQRTLRRLDRLGEMFRDLGYTAEATSLLNYAAIMWDARLGTSNRQSIAALSRVAEGKIDECAFDEAESMMLRVVEAQRNRAYWGASSMHRSVAVLGYVYHCQGRFAKADETFLKAYNDLSNGPGTEDESLLACVRLMTSAYVTQARFEEAEDLCRKTLNNIEQAAFRLDGGYLAILYNLSFTYKHQNRLLEAEEVVTRALDGFEASSGKEHKHTIASRELLTSILHRLDRFDEEDRQLLELVGHYQQDYGLEYWETRYWMRKRAWCLWARHHRWEAICGFFRSSPIIIRLRTIERLRGRTASAVGLLAVGMFLARRFWC